MKKKSIIIISVVILISVAVGVFYTIDMNRMKNNKPVVFSTWGYDYAPPETEQKGKLILTEEYYHSFVGNRDVYIGTSDMDIEIENK